MKQSIFTKTIFYSLLGHLTFFSVFNLSFGARGGSAGAADVSFWGNFPQSYQLGPAVGPLLNKGFKQILFKRTGEEVFIKSQSPVVSPKGFVKPLCPLTLVEEKSAFAEAPVSNFRFAARKEPVIILHPLLPYSFNLYFKDRQVAHVELEYSAVKSGERNLITIRRKISSGNLEVDLLSQRYIGHYLFIQQSKAAISRWQTVKIDLSAKNDQY